MKDEVLSSPIRWAGSKKRVLNELLESFDKNFPPKKKEKREGQLDF